MTWLESRRLEMEQIKGNLRDAAKRTGPRFDYWMRYSVKEVLAYQYVLEGELVEDVRERESYFKTIETAGKFFDRGFGFDSSRQRESMKRRDEWNRDRQVRVADYVQKIVDIFPARSLTRLIHSSRNMQAEQLIEHFESVKGEARQSDYAGHPSGNDPSTLIAKAIRIRRNSS